MFHPNVQEKINELLETQPEQKRKDIEALHRLILQALPDCKLWFDDGKDESNKTVTNPTIGYGSHIIKYANGKTKEFFQIGISANTTGISLYILGLKDKAYLSQTYGKTLGKASISGYCIKFKAVKDIDLNILESAVQDGFNNELRE